MSIEDINYMKENSIKQSYTFIIDSSDRDHNIYPNPNNYVINFSNPFKNVIGMEIIDASIPRAMYTVDVDNNELYYYVGREDAIDKDEIIMNGMQIENNANLILKNCSIINEELVIKGDGYAILDNSINIYNIYNNENNIGGSSIGITFNIRFKPSNFSVDGTYNIFNFSYEHTYNYVNINNISIDIVKAGTLYTFKFTIGKITKETDSNINSPFNNNGNYINLYWSISDTTWCIGIFDIINNNDHLLYQKIFNDNLEKILNVFYTKKYIGKSTWNNSRLLLTHFKIYNTSMTYADMENANGVQQSSNIMPVFYEIKDAVIIINKGTIGNVANLMLKGYAYINNSKELEITGDGAIDGYAILDNSINIYNIYNNENIIGGSSSGITFNIRFKPVLNGVNSIYNILNFSDVNLNNNISIDIVKAGTLYTLKFTIGATIKSINNNDYNFMNGNYINLYWSVSDTTWCIYVFNNSNQQIYKNIFNDNLEKILNVFYTKKYIGKSTWGTTNKLLLTHFKIYNTSMTYTDMENANRSSQLITTIPVWYEMNEVNVSVVNNKGYNAKINYKDIFKKITIIPGDYNFNTFISKYDELSINDNVEFRFNETTTIPSLSNLIDIISKAPLIIDMKRSTLAENLGFDLYPTIDNDRYIYKNKYMENEMEKMFQSRERTVKDKYYNEELPINENKYIITSPGIVYFIGNKYIIMRCPEIEEHLYRSLSFSKYSLGLAKFRVDSIGINNEKLSITKIPVREFHPIGKLSRITLKFETNKGILYDFKGVNHNIIFAIFYYEPIQKNIPTNSILNPSYKMNYIDYQYKQEEIEGDSSDGDNDDTEDFSRDNIDEYKIKENLYNERGVKLQQFRNYYENSSVNDIIDIENDDNESIDDENVEN